ncbi:MAG: hypothetical protein KF803_10830 [Cyclobacteriaceae bacterium]|nr:hypothetical protein [Cyclobacteriaceae bacterium]
MDYHKKILTDIEVHSPEGIQECFEHGVSPNDQYNGKPLIYELTSEYLRSPRFKACVRVFVKYGLAFDDTVLLSVLLNDAVALEHALKKDPTALYKTYTLTNAFTPLHDASLLHICAEHNHLACAQVLVNAGMDVNIKAGRDEHGFGGQTPIFHTVNQHNNVCMDVLKFLLAQAANLNLTVTGLVWGKGYEWETFVPAVNPISYAMMGILPQFQRTEKDVYEVVHLLMKAAFDVDYTPANIPNKYLNS